MMDGLINRQAVLKAINNMVKECDSVYVTSALRNLEVIVADLPSAETHEERTETHGVCLDAISRQDAINAMGKVQWAKVRLMELPSAQPEIIHCRDCKHWRDGDVYSYCQKLFNCGVLDVYDYMRAEDDFCSLAERLEDA